MAAAGLLAVLVACGPGAAPGAAPASTAPAGAATPAPSFVVPSPPSPAPVTGRCAPAPPRATVVDPATLSLEGRAALVLAAGIPGAVDATDDEAAALVDAGVGGVVLKAENVRDLDQVRRLVEDLATATPLGVLAFVDQEGGRVAHARAVVEDTRSARRLGRATAADPRGDDARAAGEAIGADLRAAGIHATLAPVADLDDGPYDAIIGDRSFGATADVAVPAATAFVEGLHARGTLAVAKHFPGHAGAGDTHTGTKVVDVDRAGLAEHLDVFEALVEAGVDAVMVGHVTYAAYGDLPASVNPAVYEELRDLGFDGVAVTDSLGMGAVHQGRGHGRAAVDALLAGADLLLVNQGSAAAVEMRDALVAAVRGGELSEGRLDEAARRVMRLRARQSEVAARCR